MLAAAIGASDRLMLIGDPEYYRRFFGFTADRTGQWRLPGPVRLWKSPFPDFPNRHRICIPPQTDSPPPPACTIRPPRLPTVSCRRLLNQISSRCLFLPSHPPPAHGGVRTSARCLT